MDSLCPPDTFNAAIIAGIDVTFLEADLVENYTATARANCSTVIQRPPLTMSHSAMSRLNLGPDRWALDKNGEPNIQALRNLAYVSLGDQAVIFKSVVEDFYGEPPLYSYFSGCSQGGRQGMMLAQRFPEAYDGIHACAPAMHWNDFFAYTMWPQLITEWLDYFPHRCELDAVIDAAVSACDKLDGFQDGIISDEDACDFDPLSLVGTQFFCSETNTTMTLTQQAAQIAQASWSGPTTQDGERIWYRTNIGSQLGGETTELTNDIGPAMTSCSANGTCVGMPLPLGFLWIKYFVKADPAWDYRNMTRAEFEQAVAVSNLRYDDVIGTLNPNFTAFFNEGGKILGYHGMNDQIIPVKGGEHYLDEIAEVTPDIHNHYRMFGVPGLLHCSGGLRGQPTNTFDALRAWVEEGTVPHSLPHTYRPKQGGAEVGRLLCPYPQKAALKRSCGARSGNFTTTPEDYICL